MSSLILRTATRYMQPILVLFSVFLLLAGHNEPGGGFAGGLVAAAAYALYAIAYGVEDARRLLYVSPQGLAGAGLLAAAGSGIPSLVYGKPFMTGLWHEGDVPGFGEIAVGTPLLFDVGVYLAVIGVTLSIVLNLAEEE